jgi:hypothetical protein
VTIENVRFLTQGVTPEEKAAVLAILDAQIAEESAIEHEVQGAGMSTWQKSQRGIREDIKGGSRRFGWDFGK